MDNREQQINNQETSKRVILFFVVFSTVGLIFGWPFATPHVFILLKYKAFWAVMTLGIVGGAFAADGNLWLLRNPGKSPRDYYQRKHWWLHVFNWEIKQGSPETEAADK
ncbi:hypothetical protein XJ28_01620 [Pseudomonas syringae pv. tomato]|uniref:hypothetical protein n=1 Tax=Pseudomonas syringae group genomosp. 3 TaxID=251701 RepID=UPI000CF66297|nr:hypothetical protein [Pseudomonas syringae group genomosp. 3]AVI82545.1 hypothetical protein XJ28_01620 [Pseudomonas syringae pv. tomato]